MNKRNSQDRNKKLIFGDKDSIRKRDIETIKNLLSKNKMKCPSCGRIKTVGEVVDYNIDKGWIQWAGCTNRECIDCCLNPKYGTVELWVGYTDLEMKPTDW